MPQNGQNMTKICSLYYWM